MTWRHSISSLQLSSGVKLSSPNSRKVNLRNRLALAVNTWCTSHITNFYFTALKHHLPVLILESWLCGGCPVLTVVCGAIWICDPADICKERKMASLHMTRLSLLEFPRLVPKLLYCTTILTNYVLNNTPILAIFYSSFTSINK